MTTMQRIATAAAMALTLSIAGCSAGPGADPGDPATASGSPTSSNHVDLDDPALKEIAMRLVSTAENSSTDWQAQYSYIEDIDDGRGYTAGIIGFCSGTGDMLELVHAYTATEPGNPLAPYLPALRSRERHRLARGPGPGFMDAWAEAATDPVFQAAQNLERDAVYFDPAVAQAKEDGLRALGQFAYYDAMVMHGPGDDPVSFGGIRATALEHADPPSQGGDEVAYLEAFLDAREDAMRHRGSP